MNRKQLSPEFSVSDQISAQDIKLLAESGVLTLICNRPDKEAADQPEYAELAAAASAAGMKCVQLPVVHDTINSSQVSAFAQLLASAQAPVHAWCRSGLRSTALWALARIAAGDPEQAIVDAASAQGFDFSTFGSKFRSVIAELNGSLDNIAVKAHCPVLIIGGGSGGITLASSLLKRDASLAITIVEPADTHYYQPGFTMVGGGVFNLEQTRRPMSSLLPQGVTWIQAAVAHFQPEKNMVILDNEDKYSYERLAVSAGLKLNWGAVAGLEESLGKNGVTSNYRPDLAPYTWELVSKLKSGKAIFTQPPMPIKCAGAPQKALYLSGDHWLRNGVLNNVSIEFRNAGPVLFGVKDYVPALQRYIDRYRAKVHFGNNLVAVDGPNRIATFSCTDAEDKPQKVDVKFDMLHVCPPQCAPDFMRNSPLADLAGWIDVDQRSLRHKRYANVWGLGDITNTPNAKTAAAVRKQAPVVAQNMVADLRNTGNYYGYDGYGSCPLTVERGKIVLAEFGYGGKLLPTFPSWLLEGRKPTWLAWFLKVTVLPFLYWNLMLKGNEMMASPDQPLEK